MTTERLCKQCLRWLPEEAFPKGALNPNGKPYVRYVCKQCVNFRRICQRNAAKPPKGVVRACKKCGAEKPLTEFYPSSSGTYQWTCKKCQIAAARARIRAMKVNDPEAYAEYNRKSAAGQAKRNARRAMERVTRRFQAAGD